ncbi:MAG: cysteine--tRNA ligase, partial [Acidobacteria bacterium]|nr:cysteine--tRNA ligase [Acidobacteriota bacterium]
TFDGLTESTNAIDRLRTFSQRLSESAFNTTIPLDEELASETTKAEAAFVGSLSKDLNTAEARAAIFDFVRFANTRLDERAAGGRPIGSANRDQIRALLDKFDSIFAVLEDRDADLTRDALAWAEAEGRMSQVSPEVLEKFGSTSLTDAAIEALIADRTLAKKQRNFPRADAIRKDLLEKGILLEDSKDGVRWKRT